MEAVTIAGLAVVAIGGYFSVVDFLNEAGITEKTRKMRENKSYQFQIKDETKAARIEVTKAYS